ncbi:MAG: DUF917 domain-containing protein [Candidatus Methanodesulfokora washburnensis]|jgi:DUF917 family protein
MIEIKREDQIRALILGTTILGTGGGGSPSDGLKMLNDVLKKGKTIKLVDMEEIPRDGFVVVPYEVGSIAPNTKAKKPIRIREPIRRAFEEMERIIEGKIVAVVPGEIGGGNTSVALRIAAELGIPAVDGDVVGRAAPELHQYTVNILGIPTYPSVIVSESGNVIIIREHSDIDDYEAIARYLSVLSGNYVSVVDTPMNYDSVSKAIIRKTISTSMRLGEEVIKARNEGRDPVDAVVNMLKGWRIFEGVVEKYEWRNEGGFLRGEAIIKGVGDFNGRTLRSWIKNEHIMVWIDGKPVVMPPDMFMLLKEDGEPITNTELREGVKVYGVAAKAPDIWRTPEGLKYFGPRHFGFDYDYIPVEELVKVI